MRPPSEQSNSVRRGNTAIVEHVSRASRRLDLDFSSLREVRDMLATANANAQIVIVGWPRLDETRMLSSQMNRFFTSYVRLNLLTTDVPRMHGNPQASLSAKSSMMRVFCTLLCSFNGCSNCA